MVFDAQNQTGPKINSAKVYLFLDRRLERGLGSLSTTVIEGWWMHRRSRSHGHALVSEHRPQRVLVLYFPCYYALRELMMMT
jgi:hypothetical protein